MSDTVDFFVSLTQRQTWIRVFDVILGSILVYLALMNGQNRLAGFLSG